MKFNQHSSSPPNCKNIDSSSSTLSISVGSNLTQLNSNKSIERMKPDNLINCVSGAEQNKFNKNSSEEKSFNSFCKKDPEKKRLSKDISSNDNEQNKYKQIECEKEIHRFHRKTNNTDTKNKKENKYFQKHQQQDDDTKYFAILGEITKDINTLKNLFTKDKKTNSFYKKEKTNKTNKYVNDDVCESDQRKTRMVQESIDPEYFNQNQRKNIVNSNEISDTEYGQNNVMCCCTDDQTAYIQQQTTDGYYQLQPSELYTEKSNEKVVHFFTCEKSQNCQCGIINNKSNCTAKNVRSCHPK